MGLGHPPTGEGTLVCTAAFLSPAHMHNLVLSPPRMALAQVCMAQAQHRSGSPHPKGTAPAVSAWTWRVDFPTRLLVTVIPQLTRRPEHSQAGVTMLEPI